MLEKRREQVNKVDGQQPMAKPSAGRTVRRFLHDAGIDQSGWRAADGISLSWQYYEKVFTVDAFV